MAMRRSHHAAQLAAVAVAASWGFRDASPPPSKETSDAVLLVLQEALLDTVGVLGIRLGAINIAWAEAVSGRRKKVWCVLKHELEKSFGGKGRAPGQLDWPAGVAAVLLVPAAGVAASVPAPGTPAPTPAPTYQARFDQFSHQFYSCFCTFLEPPR